MKLAVVVQRYGAQINGGAELHARYIVDLLAKQHQVDVLTTCARDYVTWRDEWPEGTETVRGVKVRRFRVSRERDVEDFGRRSEHVFEHRHSIADEIAWLESEGPTSTSLIEYVRTHAADYDYIFFFSYRYYHAYHGVRAVPGKAILVPTAERDATIGLSVFGPIFRGVRAMMYNSHEERAMIQAATKNTHVPGVVVGIGSEVPRSPVASRFRRKYNIHDPFIIYVGRIDENKGCRELFTFFTSYRPRLGQRLKLVLIGNSILPIPDHPHVHHLGFVSDQDKFDAMAAADALIMPSYYESLSMVALEAWALGRPVLANGRCDVLRGQCIRSRAGLYYDTLRGVRGDAVHADVESRAGGSAGRQRPQLFRHALRLVGDRTEVFRHPPSARAGRCGGPQGRADRASAWMAHPPPQDVAAGRRRAEGIAARRRGFWPPAPARGRARAAVTPRDRVSLRDRDRRSRATGD